MSIGAVIADSARLSLGYAERLLADVPAGKFARFATGTDGPIESNHPAFIYGHLSLYAPRVVEQLGGDISAIKPTDKFVELFSKDAQCVDDVEGSVYPHMDEITERLITSTNAAIEAVVAAPDEALEAANPSGMAKLFPTTGSMFAFYLGGHCMIHMGQMSAWRRMIGLGPA